jgi:Leucine-rich repeat (LRR) protein
MDEPPTYMIVQSRNDHGETVTSKYCECVERNLSTLPLLDEDIQSLNCNYNNFEIINLSLLPTTNLEDFSCTDSNVKELSGYSTHKKLKTIQIQRNRLKNLPEKMPNCLEELYCQDNNLEVLPLEMPNNLVVIDFSDNNVKVLPELPEKLIVLVAKNNPVVRLSKRPQTLEQVNLHFNFLGIQYHIQNVEEYDFHYENYETCRNIILIYLTKKLPSDLTKLICEFLDIILPKGNRLIDKILNNVCV